MKLAEALHLAPSIARVLWNRGYRTEEAAAAFLTPDLRTLGSPHAFSQMALAVERLLGAVRAEEPIALYADRDVDGLTGLAVLARTLRSLGATIVWGSPVKGRGVEREVVERLLSSRARVMVLIDCGTGEHRELEWMASRGIDVIIADHHRLSPRQPPALAWIHPGVLKTEDGQTPAGCVMAFKLAQALWLSFLGENDPERMDYFLFSHLDLVAMGILADRVPLTGENRTLVWHGLRRLAYSRKVGLAALTRFFRMTPRSGPLSVREVTWQLVPVLNAGGRLGRPDLTAELLITEDTDVAFACINQLLALNIRRRTAQDKSLVHFERAVQEQCSVETDPVLVALAEGLEPSVTGLAAQALVRKYGRPTFLFVSQGAEAVGSGRGTPGVDLFSWVEAHQQWVVKYGGHHGAVGLTIRTADFSVFRGHLLDSAAKRLAVAGPAVHPGEGMEISSEIDADVRFGELDAFWWSSLQRLGPFGPGHPLPLFQVSSVKSIQSLSRRRSKRPLREILLKEGASERKAVVDPDALSDRAQATLAHLGPEALPGPWQVVGYPLADSRSERNFKWVLRDLWRADG